MAKRAGSDAEGLNSSAESSSGDVNMDPEDGAAAVSLEEILKLYNQPINEEQAWAVCYQCCRTLAQTQRRRSLKGADASGSDYPRRIEGSGDVRIWRDGTVKLHFGGSPGRAPRSQGEEAPCSRLMVPRGGLVRGQLLGACPQGPRCCGHEGSWFTVLI